MNKTLNALCACLFFLCIASLDAVIIRNNTKKKIELAIEDANRPSGIMIGRTNIVLDVTSIAGVPGDGVIFYPGQIRALAAKYPGENLGANFSFYSQEAQELSAALYQLPTAEILIEESDNPKKPKIVKPDLKELKAQLLKEHQENVRPIIEESTPLHKGPVSIVTEYCSP